MFQAIILGPGVAACLFVVVSGLWNQEAGVSVVIVLLRAKSITHATLVRSEPLSGLSCFLVLHAYAVNLLSLLEKAGNAFLVVPSLVTLPADVEGSTNVYDVQPEDNNQLGHKVEDVEGGLGCIARERTWDGWIWDWRSRKIGSTVVHDCEAVDWDDHLERRTVGICHQKDLGVHSQWWQPCIGGSSQHARQRKRASVLDQLVGRSRT